MYHNIILFNSTENPVNYCFTGIFILKIYIRTKLRTVAFYILSFIDVVQSDNGKVSMESNAFI